MKKFIGLFVGLFVLSSFLSGNDGSHPSSNREQIDSVIVGQYIESAITPSSEELQDLRLLSESTGLVLSDVIEMYRGQEHFAVFVDLLREKFPEYFSTAVWTPNNANAAGIIHLAGPRNQRIMAMAMNLPFPVELRFGDFINENQLIEIMRTGRDAVAKTDGVESAESIINDYESKVTITYSKHPESSLSHETVLDSVYGALEKKGVQISSPFSVEIVQGEVASVADTKVVIGGLPIGGCTAAFTATSPSGTHGILTAGHCANSNYSYNGVTAYFSYEAPKASGDWQWHALTGHTTSNQLSLTTTGSVWVNITSQSNPTTGSAICYLGKTTGSGCGTVTAVNYCDNEGYCLLFQADTNSTEPGDSGGAWRYGSVAKGITRGYLHFLGIRISDLATRIGAITVYGYSLRTSP